MSRCKPRRQGAVVDFKEMGDHSLHRGDNASVDEHRTLGALASPERQGELPRQIEVDLHRRQRLLATLRIVDLQIDLWSVESRLARRLLVRQAMGVEAVPEHRFALGPAGLVSAVLPVLPPQREPIARRWYCQRPVCLLDHAQDRGDLLTDLLGGAEDVAIVERHLANSG